MNDIRLVSWNVNGLRAVARKGFLEWMADDDPDVLCLQETRAWAEQLPPGVREIDGYHSYFAEAETKGYSGVALYSKDEPRDVTNSFHPDYDPEGRLIEARYPELTVFNVYFPNGKASQERLDYKMAFYESFLEAVRPRVQAGDKLLVTGDVNTAHRELDLARPQANKDTSGFLPEEREWMDRFLEAGFVDTFRMFHTGGEHYSYWDLRTRARDRNVGWRIDYVFVTLNLRERVRDAFILSEVQGSDHCPVGVELEL